MKILSSKLPRTALRSSDFIMSDEMVKAVVDIKRGLLAIDAELHADLEKLLTPMLDYFCQDMPFEIKFEHINPNHHEVIYEDRTLTVTSLPLKHKVPCCGFLFREKQRQPHIIAEAIERYQIPLAEIPKIKEGADFNSQVSFFFLFVEKHLKPFCLIFCQTNYACSYWPSRISP